MLAAETVMGQQLLGLGPGEQMVPKKKSQESPEVNIVRKNENNFNQELN